MPRKTLFTIAFAALLSIATLLNANPGLAASARGQRIHGLCVSCHGENGQGNADIQAPAIAGLPEWYVVAQLEKFRNGQRGKHPSDAVGTRMRAMSRTLQPGDLSEVAQFVAGMSATETPITVRGDTAWGKTLYATCLACHGPEGKGNPALKAPPLAGGSDWYLVEQLRKYRSGLRGQAGDPTGAMMTPMAKSLPDDQALSDVVAFIRAEMRKP